MTTCVLTYLVGAYNHYRATEREQESMDERNKKESRRNRQKTTFNNGVIITLLLTLNSIVVLLLSDKYKWNPPSNNIDIAILTIKIGVQKPIVFWELIVCRYEISS